MAGLRAPLSARDLATPQRRIWQLVKTCGHISPAAFDGFFAFQRDSQMKRCQPFSETLESTRVESIKLGVFSENAWCQMRNFSHSRRRQLIGGIFS